MKEETYLNAIVCLRRRNQNYLLLEKDDYCSIFPSYWKGLKIVNDRGEKKLAEVIKQTLGWNIDDFEEKLAIMNRFGSFEEEKDFHTLSKKEMESLIEDISPYVLDLELKNIFPINFRYIFYKRKILQKNVFYIPYYKLKLSNIRKTKRKLKIISHKKILKDYHMLKGLYEPSIIKILQECKNCCNNLTKHLTLNESKLKDTLDHIHEILPFIFRYQSFRLFKRLYNSANCYIIGQEKRYIIDPNATESREIEILQKFVGENINQIEGILLTHEHSDGIKLALSLKEQFDLPIFAPKKLAEDERLESLRINYLLEDNEEIGLNPDGRKGNDKWSLKVVKLSGHTKKSYGYLDSRGILFAGDCFNVGGATIIANYDNALDDYIRSLKSLLKLKIKFILPTHDEVITNPKTFIRKQLRYVEDKERLILKAIKANRFSLEEIALEINKNPKMHVEPKDETTLIPYLKRLVTNNIIEQRGEEYFFPQKRKLFQRRINL